MVRCEVKASKLGWVDALGRQLALWEYGVLVLWAVAITNRRKISWFMEYCDSKATLKTRLVDNSVWMRSLRIWRSWASSRTSRSSRFENSSSTTNLLQDNHCSCIATALDVILDVRADHFDETFRFQFFDFGFITT